MTPLQWIIKEAKAIRKKNPKMEWKKAVAQASAIYANKHKGKSPVGKKHAKKKTVKKKAVKKVGVIKKKAIRKTATKRVKRKPTEKAVLKSIKHAVSVQKSHMAGIGGESKTQAGAIVRVHAKHKLRAAGYNVPAEISTNDLNKLYKHITGKNIPTVTKVRKLLKKFNNNTNEVYKHL